MTGIRTNACEECRPRGCSVPSYSSNRSTLTKASYQVVVVASTCYGRCARKVLWRRPTPATTRDALTPTTLTLPYRMSDIKSHRSGFEVSSTVLPSILSRPREIWHRVASTGSCWITDPGRRRTSQEKSRRRGRLRPSCTGAALRKIVSRFWFTREHHVKSSILNIEHQRPTCKYLPRPSQLS